MARTMCIAVAFMLATALAQANPCSSGGECPSDRKATNIMSLLQTNLQMNVLKDAGGKATGAHTIKLIVNSDVRYDSALNTLFESMKKVSFDRWNDVIVMRGTASNDSDPFTPETEYGKRGVTYVDLKLSSFDLHGFSGLHRHRNHPRVKANVYFCIHDTVLVNKGFPHIFHSMASTGEFEARHSPLPCKNQCVIGSGVVEAYDYNFDFPKTKTEGFCIENSLPPYHNVVSYATKQTLLKEGIEGPAVDLWHTGHPRTPTYFPDLGLTKYSFSNGYYGDLTGHLKKYDFWSLLETNQGPHGLSDDMIALKAHLLKLSLLS